MMNDGFGATTEEMDRAGKQVLTVNDTVQSDLAMLRARLAPLAGAWRGDAAAAFGRLMDRWDADARIINDSLRTIGQSIGGAGQDYRAHEEQNAAGLSNIRAALG
ncbi:WXG100 family type VII secretion target [Pseudonocardia humida]|uniref:ESAT-6-like protein n=1 Tax=Pseudonocardia humida TaxID=2800819 RepID=A0ABT0ZW19_9PSEU|nr:WXG100 family type VII secretion target [Pseudonocardia humida]MCO1654932.1 WXG100 family type VII secretion target [Pseudonocardia humida]